MKALFTFSLLTLLAAPVFAVDGVTLINQSTVMASGGFPYQITAPGSYQLSGNLIAPAGTQAILVLASDVVLDLNGFNVSCVLGAGSGTPVPHHLVNASCVGDSGASPSGISDVTILNGTVNLTQTAPSATGVNMAVGFFGTPFVIAEKLHVQATNSSTAVGIVIGLAFGANSIIRHNILSGSGPGLFNGVAETCPSVLEGNVNTSFNSGGSGCLLFNNIGGFN